MNSTSKFLVSALLIHAANLKKLEQTQSAVPAACPTNPDLQPTPLKRDK